MDHPASKATVHAVTLLLGAQDRARNQMLVDCAETDGVDAMTHKLDLARRLWVPLEEAEPAPGAGEPGVPQGSSAESGA